MMATVTVHAAKTHLSKLIKRVEAGEEIVIARGDRPVVRLVPYAAKVDKSKGFGSMKGLIDVGPEFFEPLPDEELEAWDR
ncbi:MAG: type II toxin-antitoxin system Phd/YefM family antitoxin [Rhodospirillaceae bacterium]|nr:type II toxin-antitoxin system Phd/YefM family antitoxin [Rhodospirillaceae bacterium]